MDTKQLARVLAIVINFFSLSFRLERARLEHILRTLEDRGFVRYFVLDQIWDLGLGIWIALSFAFDTEGMERKMKNNFWYNHLVHSHASPSTRAWSKKLQQSGYMEELFGLIAEVMEIVTDKEMADEFKAAMVENWRNPDAEYSPYKMKVDFKAVKFNNDLYTDEEKAEMESVGYWD
jgi:hypothetical protein